ncbi:MAG: zinc ribbon domain-containing protein [Methanoregula sp.]
MGYPDLKSDESIILTAQHVKVKSVPFELVLTNRRLILIDSEKNVVPTQLIPLITIRNVATGENAIRDPVITLTILTDTADTRELALTFAMQTSGERKREAGEWVKALKKQISDAISYPVEMAPDVQVNGEIRHESTGTPGVKKKVEISRPIKRVVVDTSHLPPKPVETTSLPEGSFCARCGNRLPAGSTFCNRCGTKVVSPDVEAAAPVSPGQISTAPLAAPGSGDHKGRPIEEIIHSIEPLIEDSVPRTVFAQAIPEPEQALSAPTPIEAPAAAPAAETAPATEQTPAPAAEPVATPAVPLMPPVPPLPPVPAAPRKKRMPILTIAIIVIVIIAVVAGGFMVMKNMQKTTEVQPVTTTLTTIATTMPTTIPTTIITTAVTTAVPTTAQVLVPQTGIWVEITYDKTYTGLVGTPGSQVAVTDTGDHFYIIPTSDGTVAVSLQKTDGSGDELKVVIYKDGSEVKTVSTSTPKGRIDLQFALATPTPTTTAELTPLPTLPLTTTVTTAVNATNSTA